MRMDENQKAFISAYATAHGKSMAAFMLEAALDVIEDAIDLRDWKAAKAEFDADPVTFSNEDIMKEFCLPTKKSIPRP